MKASEGQYVLETIENEGFGYAFLDYSDFKNIEDEEFHRLRQAFVKAAEELGHYLGCDV